jgi:hypothetical protein
VHDYFDILGVARNAPAEEIRRACARRAWKGHPDFDDAVLSVPARRTPAGRLALADLADVAIDFVDLSEIVDRMKAAFFAADR